MKCQILFSGKNKKNMYIYLNIANFLFLNNVTVRTLSVLRFSVQNENVVMKY